MVLHGRCTGARIIFYRHIYPAMEKDDTWTLPHRDYGLSYAPVIMKIDNILVAFFHYGSDQKNNPSTVYFFISAMALTQKFC